MRTRLVATSLLALLPRLIFAADDATSAPASLYVLSTQTAAAEDGQPLTMTVRESKRAPDYSIVDVEVVAGGTASSLFLVRGLCGLMQARDRKLAVAEQVSEHPVEFRLTFPASAKVDGAHGVPSMVLSEANCARVQAPHP